jgi:peptidoglycan-N-acetylglucosamine deacetylase
MILGVALGAVAAGGIAHGTFHRNSFLFGKPITHVGPGKCLSLTFDDGPNPEATPRILDALAARGVQATFFVLGRHVERWPRLARRIADEGHVLGNHGYYHRKLHFKSPGYVRRDLQLGTDIIERVAHVRPRYFRAPHGFRSPWVTSIAQSLGQRTVGWSLGVWDSDRPGIEAIVERAVHGVRPGSILLLHDGDGYDPSGDRMQTARAVPLIVDRMLANDFRFVPLNAA